jgi:Mce-associated membrane protein
MQSSAGLRSTLVQYHATSKATVIGAGLQSATTDRAVVLVFLDQIIANSQQAAPTTDRSRVLLTLVHSNGRWLINDVKLR